MSTVTKFFMFLFIIFIAFSFSFIVLLAGPTLIDDVSHIVDESYSSAEPINESKLTEMTYDKLNNERSNIDIHRLEKREDIEEVSVYKTNRMISEDYISHQAPDGESVRDRFEKFDVDCQIVGENLAKTYYNSNVDSSYSDDTIRYESMDELSTGVTNQFMNSPSHKDNLLDNNWEYHGISIQITTDDVVYVTHKFCV